MSAPTSMRVMSFNIRGALFDDGFNCWAQRSEINVRLIRHHAPDLIGFQELHLANLTKYLKAFPEYAFHIGPPYNNSQPFQYPAIFWRRETFQTVSSGGFWLSDTPDRFSSSWDTACIRSAAWVKLVWRSTGLEFMHINTHLDHVSELARQNSAALIAQQLISPMPVILTGDFNCPPGSPTYNIFCSHAFQDTYELAGKSGPAYTFHNFMGSEFIPAYSDFDRIDWILTRGWEGKIRIEDFAIIHDADPPLFPSDHYPVTSVFRSVT